MTWTKQRLSCLVGEDAHTARCVCARSDYIHAATYRAEMVNADTGEVDSRTMCFERGRAFAEKHQLEFPPWRDLTTTSPKDDHARHP